MVNLLFSTHKVPVKKNKKANIHDKAIDLINATKEQDKITISDIIKKQQNKEVIDYIYNNFKEVADFFDSCLEYTYTLYPNRYIDIKADMTPEKKSKIENAKKYESIKEITFRNIWKWYLSEYVEQKIDLGMRYYIWSFLVFIWWCIVIYLAKQNESGDWIFRWIAILLYIILHIGFINSIHEDSENIIKAYYDITETFWEKNIPYINSNNVYINNKSNHSIYSKLQIVVYINYFLYSCALIGIAYYMLWSIITSMGVIPFLLAIIAIWVWVIATKK